MKNALMVLVLIASVDCTAAVWKAGNAGDVKRLAKRLQAGDTLLLASGEWRDAKMSIDAAGTESRQIVVTAESAGKTVFTGNSSLSISGSWITVSGLFFDSGALEEGSVVSFKTSSEKFATHCRLTNCAIVNYNPTDKYLDYKWVSLYGRYNRVDHCTFTGKNHQGTLLVVWLDGEPNDHHIDHNYFGPRPEHDRNGAEIIRVGTSQWSMSTSRTIVEYNFFDQCNGEYEIISSKSCENIYRYNTFQECAGTLTLRHGNRCEVYGNWFFGNRKKNTGGVRIIGENQRVYDNWFQELGGGDRYAPLAVMDGVKDTPLNGYFQVKNAVISRNIFVACNRGIVLGVRNNDYSGFVPADTLSISKNVFYRVESPVVVNSKPNAPFYSGNTVCEGKGTLPSGFEAKTFDAPSATMLLQFLREDNRAAPVRIPVTADDVGATWFKKELK